MSDPVGEHPAEVPGEADGPRLPSSVGHNPSIVVPPRQNDAESDTEYRSETAVDRTGNRKFAPLRSDPPPTLLPTWLLRYGLVGLLFAALGVTLWTEYRGAPGDVGDSALVAALHIGAAACLVVWSGLAMHNSQALVPATRYQSKARGWLAALLWTLALIAPAGVALAYDRLVNRLSDPDDQIAVATFVPVVFVAFVLVWLPFRYCARQAARIGAPHLTMIAWFWVTLIAVIGSLGINALGLDASLAENSLTAGERVLALAVTYGLPVFVFALASWRATTVFDEVIDLRWTRWKDEWEQTLRDFSAQPEPGPEASPAMPPASS